MHSAFASLQTECPSKLVFVLKEGEHWTNNGGSDFTAQLAPKSINGEGAWLVCLGQDETVVLLGLKHAAPGGRRGLRCGLFQDLF
jgi:hypothetical protein